MATTELSDGGASPARDAITDVDASDLLRRMSSEDRRAVEQAWRDPSAACRDGVTAAVARNRTAKQVRAWRWQTAIWTFVTLLWLVSTLGTGSAVRVVNVVLAAALAATGWWGVLRGRRSLRALDDAADPEAAAAEAVELRARRAAG